MRMMRKMKNPRIGMASPSEPFRESTNQGIRDRRSHLWGIPVTHEGLVCVHCKANHGARRIRCFRIADAIQCCLSGVRLIALIPFIGRFNAWTSACLILPSIIGSGVNRSTT